MTASREDFLGELFKNARGLVELRAITTEGKVCGQGYSKPESAATRESFVQRNAAHHLFVGVAARKDGSSGKLDNCDDVGAAWADVDFKLVPEAEAQGLARAFPLPPSIAVRSGYGVHLYWLFLRRLAAQDPRLRQVLAGLAQALRGDPAVVDPARVLRLPGSKNWKYTPAPEVIVSLWRPERRYTLEALLAAVPLVVPSAPPNGRAPGEVPIITLAPLEPVVAGCDFLRWARDHQPQVSEPLWHAMLSNLSRCEGGRAAAHAFSREHFDYTPAETDAKFDRTLEGSDPITCARIQALGFTGCPAGGHGVASPAALGLRAREGATAAEPAFSTPPPIRGGNGHATTTEAAPPRPEAGAPDPEPDAKQSAPGPEPGASRSSAWKRWDAADDWKFPEPAYWIDQLLPDRGVMWVAGVAHSGKSLLLEYLALALACGREQAAQHFRITAPKDLNILYVSQEDPGGRTEQRRNEILAAWGVRPEPGRLTFLIKEDVDLQNAQHRDELRNLCLELGAKILILDTWTALSPSADPLAAKEQAELARIAVALADAIGGLVIIIDHARKNVPDGGAQTLADLFGPVQKSQRAEHALLLRALEGPERRIEVFVDSKDGDGIERFFLERSAKDSNLEKFTYAGTVQAAADQQREIGVQNRERVYALIPAAPDFITKALIVARLAPDDKTGNAPDGKPGLSKTSVERHLRALVDAGGVKRTGSGRGTAYQRCAPPADTPQGP